MLKHLHEYYKQHPYQSILFLAIILRLVAVLFSEGYAFADDHFLIIEASKSWADGFDYNNWLPKNQVNPEATGHSFFYVGIHYLFFVAIKFIGVADAKIAIIIIRLLNALFSLLIVTYGYKITLNLTNNKQTATHVMLLFAILWFMPFLSVRDLVEFACIPFIFIGIYWLLTPISNKNYLLWIFLAGIMLGFSFSVRFQLLIVIGGLGLVLLFKNKWKEALIFGLGAIISIFLIQGVIDIFIWGKPFTELKGYIVYNLEHKNEYGVNNWSMYFSVVLGLLIPPMSLLWGWGFLKVWKKHLLIFLPTILFFAFHTYFPNKQERFIFSIIPFFLILGVIGWSEIQQQNNWVKNHKNIFKYIVAFFWIINTVLLIVMTPMSSKKSRINAMYYLYDKENVSAIIIEDALHNDVAMLPRFYSGKWNIKHIDVAEQQYNMIQNNDSLYIASLKEVKPSYVYFCESKNMETRLLNMKKVFPNLNFERAIEPSALDKLMYKLTSSNRNQTYFIYNTEL